MTLPGPRFTYDDYKLLPEGKRYEIIEGELLVTPAPNIRHQRIVVGLLVRLFAFVKAEGLGEVLVAPTDVILEDDQVVQPDLLFVAKERQSVIRPGAIHGAPDLVIEILSPSTAGRDQVLKRKLYGKYGVQEFWIIDPDSNTIEVLTLTEKGLEPWKHFSEGSTLTSPLLPGLHLAVSDLLAQ